MNSIYSLVCMSSVGALSIGPLLAPHHLPETPSISWRYLLRITSHCLTCPRGQLMTSSTTMFQSPHSETTSNPTSITPRSWESYLKNTSSTETTWPCATSTTWPCEALNAWKETTLPPSWRWQPREESYSSRSRPAETSRPHPETRGLWRLHHSEEWKKYKFNKSE